MWSVSVLLVLGLLRNTPGTWARPKDKGHRGLYDDVKVVPFVDEKIEDSDTGLVPDWNKLGNEDKYNKIYDLYNKHTSRAKIDKQDSETVQLGDNNTVGSDESDAVDVSSLPVEGGLDQGNNDRVGKSGRSGKKRHHRHGKSRANRVHPHESASTKIEKDSVKEDEKAHTATNINSFPSEDLSDKNNELFKFFDEDPNFKKNVGVITDGKVTDSGNKVDTRKDHDTSDESQEVDKDVVKDSEDADVSVSNDKNESDEADTNETGEKEDPTSISDDIDGSHDLSSEMYDDAYEYYDGENESSYSSSEMEEERNINGDETPYDWFKVYDKIHGKQALDKDNTKEPASQVQNDESYSSDKKNTEDNIVDSLESTDNKAKPVTSDFYENVKKSLNNIQTEINSKTDDKNLMNSDSTLEPSTSPNPPTAKKEWKSMVTQPAHTERKHNSEYVTYIESRPVEACDVDWDCPPGRYCKFGLCICGHADLCEGHNKPVCGSDGILYPSHCELHRTACVTGIHIRIAAKESCSQDKNSEDNGSSASVDEEPLQAKPNVDQHSLVVESTENSVEDTESLNKEEINTDPHIDNKVEVKDVVLGLLAADTGKPKVGLDHGDHSKESKEETDNSEASVQSFEYDDYDSDSLNDESEEESEDVSDESLDGEKDLNSDNSIQFSDSERNDSREKIEDSVESEESEENLFLGKDSVDTSDEKTESSEEKTEGQGPSLIPLYCTPDKYMEFKANVLQYHCLFFEEPNCDRQTQDEKHKLAAVMFNYFDNNYNGRIEKEELWKMQLTENMDQISSLCTLLDIVTFDELGVKDGKLSPDEFIQAFDIPDLLEHRLEVVPLLATIGNGLEVKCDVTLSHDVIWRRNGMDLSLLSFPGISVLGDGSLYIESVGAHMVGNLTCHDRNKPSVKQVHVLTVQKPPHVMVSPVMSEYSQNTNVQIHCHAEGLPAPIIEWQFNDRAVEHGEKYYIHTYDNSLTVMDADYLQDSGVYKCLAHNKAGMAQAMATVTIHNPNDTAIQDFYSSEESFIVFHDDGYTMHEPTNCLTQRHVKPDFGNFYFIPDELDEAPSMCEKGIPCVWGSSVNVRNRFVYVTQPRANRVMVVDVKDTLNPNQVIPTDHMPVSLYYLSHLDEVWVMCWNGEEDSGTKTILVIRDASKKTQHHTIHTQPIGNRFDMVQDIFLPPDSELHHPYHYGYSVRNGQQGLFKLDLIEKKYLKAVDFTMYQCVPKAMAFVPLGGQVLVRCVKSSSFGDKEILLQMDYITDIVISNETIAGTPYVTPDSRNVVIVDQHTGQIKVFTVTEHGEITDEFDLTVGSPVSSATFHKASYNQGYDLYLTSVEAPVLFSISLLNGKIDVIRDIGEPDSDFFLPWFEKTRPLVSGDVFSNYLSTTAMSRMVIFNGKHHSIQCDYTDLDNPLVIAYTRLTNN